MSSTFSTALTLLLVGMITVFVVLLLVVLTGNFLITIVNRFFPLSEQTSVSDKNASAIGNKELAVITAAVEIVTEGKGHITQIKKKNG